MEIQNAVVAKQQAMKLAGWLQEQGISFDDAMPVLAMTMGLILGKQAQGRPEAVIDEGVDIATAMVRVAAYFEAQQKPTRQH
jgi:hypothetical protein